MKTIIRLFHVVLFLSVTIYGKSNAAYSTSHDFPLELEDFLTDFTNAVKKHDQAAVMALMDRNYVSEQHDGFFKGRTEQFLNEFFCGEPLSGEGFECIDFNKIISVEQLDIIDNEDSYYVEFTIASDSLALRCGWTITITQTEDEEQVIYGLYGAVG